MKKALIIYNPVSGNDKGEKYNEILFDHLNNYFDDVQSIATEKEKDATVFAEKGCLDGYNAIFAIGGDGTVNEVAKGIIDAKIEKKPILGIVPAGTFNGVSRILGFPQNPKSAIKAFDFSKTLDLDVGKINNNYFNMIFSIGDVPEALHNVSNEEKAMFSVFAYAVNIARDAMENNHHHLKIKANEEIINGYFSHVVVMLSSALYGTPIVTNLKRNDGYLHLFLLKEASLFDKLSIFPDIISGNLKDNDNIRYLKCTKVSIESLKGKVETDVDGDKSDSLPVEISIIPKALKVYSLN